MKNIALEESLFQGAVSLEAVGSGVKPWRIPYAEKELFPPDGVGMRAEMPAGVRLRFASDTPVIHLECEESEQERVFDCLINGQLQQTVVLAPDERLVTLAGLGPEDKMIDIYLSQKATVTIKRLSVEQTASVRIPSDSRPRWITYGSSITQCGSAPSPSLTWPALVAQQADYNLSCLGYGGNCHIEPMVARMIRDMEADYISLCLGINTYSGSYNLRTFRPAVIGFIKIVREKHPDIPLVVLSPIYSRPREATESQSGLTLQLMRSEIEAAVEALVRLGDRNLHYCNGLDLFGPEYGSYMPDELHPDAQGNRIIAERFAALALPFFGKNRQPVDSR